MPATMPIMPINEPATVNNNARKSRKVSPLIVGLSNKKPHQRLSKAISTARMTKKLSQKDAAKVFNVKLQVYADWENGKVIPPTATIRMLEKEFGVQLPGPGTPAAEKKLATEKRIATDGAKATGVGKERTVKVALAAKKNM